MLSQRRTAQEGLSPDLSESVSFSLTVNPVADGVVAGSLAVVAAKAAKEYTAPLAADQYTVALDTVLTAVAIRVDDTEGNEELFYKVQLPYGQLSLVSLDGEFDVTLGRVWTI